jgi:tetratricopeptide (TPR) repeat protein
MAGAHQDDDFQTFALMNLGHVTLRQAELGEQGLSHSRFARALSLLDAALDRIPEQRPFYRINALHDRASTLLGLGRPDQARTCAVEAVDLARNSGTPLILASALRSLAEIKLALDDHDGAYADLTESLELFHVLGDTVREAEVSAQRDSLTE